MADVQPFRALRFRPNAVRDLGQVLAPPYDVISPAEQEACYRRDNRNIIRLEFGLVMQGDTADDNRYTRARATLSEWLRDGVVGEDGRPAYYAYEQEFTHAGRRLTRRGFFAAVRVQPWSDGAVLPHEKTLDRPKEDRLELLRAIRTNVSPVLSLYDDPSGTVQASLGGIWDEQPLVTASDAAGEGHRLWALDDPARCAAISRTLGAQPLYIADGHHRYETALAYYQERCAELRGEPAEDAARVLMVLVAADDPGLLVLPTHRTVRDVHDGTLVSLAASLAPFFSFEELPGDATASHLLGRLAQAGEGGHALLLAGPGSAVRLLRLRPDAPLPPRTASGTAALHDLDVWLAHALVLDGALGLGEESASREEHLSYTRDAGEALSQVRDGSAQLALLLNATPVAAIMRVAGAGATMPQKSTYFYPKLVTGLVMRLLH
jgi:uncharacterized protein (DUF1015 family)